MKRLVLLLLALALPSGPLRAGRVLVLSGTQSAPAGGERNYAIAVARRVSGWLGELGVAHEVVEEARLDAGRLSGPGVAVLAYNPHPSGRHLDLLKRFVARGGRLIVFYSAEPALASMLGLKLGTYQAAPMTGRWSEIRFGSRAPDSLPARVLQTSRNIRRVHPATPGARVIARWYDAAGRDTGDPAWVLSENGAWMTHVLLDDGDTWNKKHMLLGLVGHFEPSAWESAARRACGNVGRLGIYANIDQAVSGITRLARGRPRRREAGERLREAGRLHARCAALLDSGDYAAAWGLTRDVRQALMRAYGLAQKARAGEVRGVWDHKGVGLYPGDWPRTCRVLAGHGITDLYVNVLGHGRAHYPTRVLQESEIVPVYGDQLEQCLAAAHRYGLRVHAWKVCWTVESAPAGLRQRLKQEGRLQVSDKGTTVNWLCPSNLENLKWEKDSIREIVGKYDVDGLHLDFIRYRDSSVCFCSTCREAFVAATGARIDRWPADAREGPLLKAYRQWRCGRITRLVHDVSVFARHRRPGLKLSAAVYGRYPLCADSVAQDWGDWVRRGYLDYVCPMNYTADLKKFRAWTFSQARIPAARGRIYPGIGVTANESRLDPAEVIDQVVSLRKLGAGGFVLFDLDRVLEHETLPILSLGLTADHED